MGGGGGGQQGESQYNVQTTEPWAQVQPFLLDMMRRQKALQMGQIPGFQMPALYDQRTGSFVNVPSAGLGALSPFNLPSVVQSERQVGRDKIPSFYYGKVKKSKRPKKGLADITDFLRAYIGEDVPLFGQLGPGRIAYPVSPSSYFVAGPLYNQPR